MDHKRPKWQKGGRRGMELEGTGAVWFVNVLSNYHIISISYMWRSRRLTAIDNSLRGIEKSRKQEIGGREYTWVNAIQEVNKGGKEVEKQRGRGECEAADQWDQSEEILVSIVSFQTEGKWEGVDKWRNRRKREEGKKEMVYDWLRRTFIWTHEVLVKNPASWAKYCPLPKVSS